MTTKDDIIDDHEYRRKDLAHNNDNILCRRTFLWRKEANSSKAHTINKKGIAKSKTNNKKKHIFDTNKSKNDKEKLFDKKNSYVSNDKNLKKRAIDKDKNNKLSRIITKIFRHNICKKTKTVHHQIVTKKPILKCERNNKHNYHQLIKKNRNITSSNDLTISLTQDNDVEYQDILEARDLDQAGNGLLKKGRYHEALKSYTQALNLKRQSLKLKEEREEEENNTKKERSKRDDHTTSKSNRVKNQLLASVATSMNNIGFLRQHIIPNTSHDTNTAAATTDTNNNKEIIMSIYEESLQIKTKILGENDLSIGKTLNNIGSLYFIDKIYDKAMTTYQRALDIMAMNLGMSHLDVATVVSNIGDVYYATNRWEEARICYDRALQTRWDRLGSNNPKTIRLLDLIATIDITSRQQLLSSHQSMVYYERSDDDYYYRPSDSYTKLRKDIQKSILFVNTKKRKLEMEMFRDRIEIICGMREI